MAGCRVIRNGHKVDNDGSGMAEISFCVMLD
jgi:hypothetical protein